MNKQLHDYQTNLDRRLWERKPKVASEHKSYLDSLPDVAHKAVWIPIEIVTPDLEDQED
jgi:RNAse (barnase) inhibitor barstar